MVTAFRLYLLRATYLMIFLFLTTQIWPQVIDQATRYPLMSGVARCLLAAMAPFFLLGLRHPLKMLPVLLFELAWKAIWVAAVGMPLWFAHAIDASNYATFKACLIGVIVISVVIPWPYVIDAYFRAAGDRWKRAPSGA